MSILSDAFDRANAALLRLRGEAVTYHGAGGAADPLSISVVWDDAETGKPKGVRATAWTLESNFNPAPAAGDIVRREGVEYRIVDQPDGRGGMRDGSGGITLYLKLAKHATNA